MLLVACSPASRPPNVLVVVLDTFRADRLAAYGGTRGLTPFLDELATRSAVFERSYSASSWTCPSVAAFLTSRYPLQHGVHDYDSVLGESELTLAEALRPLGYETVGFSANPLLDGKRGYGQGFDRWNTLGARGQAKVRGDTLRRETLVWLDARPKNEGLRPVLLYVHFMDTHSSYDPPALLRRVFAPGVAAGEVAALNSRLHDRAAIDRFSTFTAQEVALLRALYDAESMALDSEVRRLFKELEKRGFLENAFVVVTSDHGEEFREHGVMMHGHTLYEPAVRVPLLLSGPGIEPGRHSAAPVSALDVAPTLLALLGAPEAPTFEGRSLLSRLGGTPPATADDGAEEVLLELPQRDRPTEFQLHHLGLLSGSHKLLVDPEGAAVAFDLVIDPEEREPELVRDDPLAARLHAQREQLATRGAAPAARVPIDAKMREQLRALGYAAEPSHEEARP
jgi:arylsulfatase A-like enzyme